MSEERWVNAVIEFLIPLEISPDAPDEEKRDAAVDAFEREFAEAASDHMATIGFEVVSSAEEEGGG